MFEKFWGEKKDEDTGQRERVGELKREIESLQRQMENLEAQIERWHGATDVSLDQNKIDNLKQRIEKNFQELERLEGEGREEREES